MVDLNTEQNSEITKLELQMKRQRNLWGDEFKARRRYSQKNVKQQK